MSFQRRIVGPGPLVDPVAGVVANSFCGDAAKRIIQRLHVYFASAAALGRIEPRKAEQLGQKRIVNLH